MRKSGYEESLTSYCGLSLIAWRSSIVWNPIRDMKAITILRSFLGEPYIKVRVDRT
jgi:hypothetical protein